MKLMKLFDLSGSEDDRKTSPYCWRIRLALAHKQLGFSSVPWRAEEKDAIAFSGQGQVRTPCQLRCDCVQTSSRMYPTAGTCIG